MQLSPVRSPVIPFVIKDKNSLYASYMPFLQEGGLFIATQHHYTMGQEVLVLLTLMDEPEKIPLIGQVIWKTPSNASHHYMAGIGLQFNQHDSAIIRSKIEFYLNDFSATQDLTYTL